ncbi:MAG: hypothetical protein VXZ35_10030 [Pseudomonadota bacterium]|nr:hypothetical protein [Pseudomonadota bacterium]
MTEHANQTGHLSRQKQREQLFPSKSDLRGVFDEQNTELLFRAFEKHPGVKSFGCICFAEQITCTIKLVSEAPFNGDVKRYSLLASEYSRLMVEHNQDFSAAINAFADEFMERLLVEISTDN